MPHIFKCIPLWYNLKTYTVILEAVDNNKTPKIKVILYVQ